MKDESLSPIEHIDRGLLAGATAACETMRGLCGKDVKDKLAELRREAEAAGERMTLAFKEMGDIVADVLGKARAAAAKLADQMQAMQEFPGPAEGAAPGPAEGAAPAPSPPPVDPPARKAEEAAPAEPPFPTEVRFGDLAGAGAPAPGRAEGGEADAGSGALNGRRKRR